MEIAPSCELATFTTMTLTTPCLPVSLPTLPPSPGPQSPTYLVRFSGKALGAPPSPHQWPRHLGQKGLWENTQGLKHAAHGRHKNPAGNRENEWPQRLTCPVLRGPFHTEHCTQAGGDSRRRKKTNSSLVSPWSLLPLPAMPRFMG